MSAPVMKPVAKPLINPVNLGETPPRLPCRGCMPDCTNYRRCDGKLWRQKAVINV